MNRTHRTSFISSVIVISFFFSVFSAEAKKDKKIDFKSLSGQILQKFYEFDPVFATSMGIHDHDGKFMNLETKALKKQMEEFHKLDSKLSRIRVKRLSDEDRIDYKILKGELTDRLKQFEELETAKRNPCFYLIHGLKGIYLLYERNPGSPALPNRLKAFPDLIENGMMNISYPYKIYLDTAKDIAKGAIVYFQGIDFPPGPDYNVVPVINSLKTFYIFLMGLEESDPSFPIDKDYYLWKLKDYYFVEGSLKEMEDSLKEIITKTDEEYKNYLESLPQTEFEPRYKPIDDVVPPVDYSLNKYISDINKEIDEVEKYVRDSNFISIPEDKGTITTKIKPTFMYPYSSGLGFEPQPPFEKEQYAFLYLKTSPEKFNEQNYKNTLFGEMKDKLPYISITQLAYPGHYLQRLHANEHPSDIRKIHHDIVFENGWSFYSEQLMHQKGLYVDHLKFSPIIINGKKYRAIRALAELKLCTGELDLDGASELIGKYLGAESVSIFKKMLQNSAFTPLNYLSYSIGKIQIDKLREKSVKAQKGKFNEKKFHDKLLMSGSIPIVFKKIP